MARHCLYVCYRVHRLLGLLSTLSRSAKAIDTGLANPLKGEGSPKRRRALKETHIHLTRQHDASQGASEEPTSVALTGYSDIIILYALIKNKEQRG